MMTFKISKAGEEHDHDRRRWIGLYLCFLDQSWRGCNTEGADGLKKRRGEADDEEERR